MNKMFFDTEFNAKEQLPRTFKVDFKSFQSGDCFKTKVILDGHQIGDVIDDNSKMKDGYRFHDVFHYTFATMLGWSPCTRAMMKRKRKSNPVIDKEEDGARALITEESISLIIFNKAKRKNFYNRQTAVSKALLNQIKEMTEPFEVSIRTHAEWQHAILTGYSVFRKLVLNNGGKVSFDLESRKVEFEA